MAKMKSTAHAHRSTLDEKRFALAAGIISALWVLIMGFARIGMGGSGGMTGRYGGMMGYGSSLGGVALGIVFAFVASAVIGYAFAWLYNKLQ